MLSVEANNQCAEAYKSSEVVPISIGDNSVIYLTAGTSEHHADNVIYLTESEHHADTIIYLNAGTSCTTDNQCEVVPISISTGTTMIVDGYGVCAP